MPAKTAFVFLTMMLAIYAASAQAPTPVIVQVVPAPATATAVPGQAAEPSASADSVLKALQELKTTNDGILKKQTATLQQLDEIEKAAEQLKIYSKRG